MPEIERLIKRWGDAVRRGAAARAELQAAMKEESELRKNLQILMAPHGRLAPRPTEVLTLLHQGKSNKEIAAALDMSMSTVKSHMQALLHKFDAADRYQLIRSTPWASESRP